MTYSYLMCTEEVCLSKIDSIEATSIWFDQYGLTTWITNHMPGKVWDELTYPFPNFNGATVEVWEWIGNFIPHFMIDVITYPCWYLS